MVDHTFPLYEELTAIILKTEGVAKVIAERLDGIGAIDQMFIYGSFARGEAGAESDIDLFIVGQVDEGHLIVAVQETEEALGREINYALFTPEEMEERIARDDPFVTHVFKGPKVVLIGDA